MQDGIRVWIKGLKLSLLNDLPCPRWNAHVAWKEARKVVFISRLFKWNTIVSFPLICLLPPSNPFSLKFMASFEGVQRAGQTVFLKSSQLVIQGCVSHLWFVLQLWELVEIHKGQRAVLSFLLHWKSQWKISWKILSEMEFVGFLHRVVTFLCVWIISHGHVHLGILVFMS